MLIDGVWTDEADETMQDGRYRRQASTLPQSLDSETESVATGPGDLIFIASQSCPWSHAATIVHALNDLGDRIPMHIASGPRTQGYRLAKSGPLAGGEEYVHQLYRRTDPDYTGRATVPLLWDRKASKIISNESTSILRFFDVSGPDTDLRPAEHLNEIDPLLESIHSGLANAVYRAGKAQRQDEYDQAVSLVYTTLHSLEDRLRFRKYLVTTHLTEPDIRLFATLVRFDSVYATHFRCTRYRLTDFPNLWNFTRDIYRFPNVRKTVNFDEIRSGYYLNDGDHNPHGIVADQPMLDW
ncbi:glutathione S-transferase C-terminal domain-containing protein [Yoonia sp. 2307UL14-13]|uniref:glutathione S-transferase C-terminal domain-containing protein n=1 Tax=Yoonia sp. 2307UL14-13 TaxID=3126506 RepID=UPI0030AA3F0E